jgi:phosphate-selective porin OprO/OprP
MATVSRTPILILAIAGCLSRLTPIIGAEAICIPPPAPTAVAGEHSVGAHDKEPLDLLGGAAEAASWDAGPLDGEVLLDRSGWQDEQHAPIPDAPTRFASRQQSRRSSRSGQYPTFKWSGFIQVDSGWWIQDEANVASVGQIADRTGLRRVRLRAYGNLRRTTAYVVDLDFAASGHPSFRDVALTFHEIPVLENIWFGYFQQPFSMQALTSGQQLLFLERCLPFAFAPFRQTGLSATGTRLGDRIQWAASVYRFPTDAFGRSIGGSGGYAVASRVTCLPWYRANGRRLFHMGFSYSMGNPGDNLVRYRIQPGFFVSQTGGSAAGGGVETGVPVFVDTGDILTDTYSLYNAELGANLGPVHLQSEVTFAVVDQREGPVVAFSGAYAQMGYYLTGESRPYDLKRGVFGHAEPFREFGRCGQGFGALEVAAGWSFIDLDDANILGGKMNEYSLSLNWYPNALAKMVLNFTHGFLRDPDLGPSEAKALGLRAQFKF